MRGDLARAHLFQVSCGGLELAHGEVQDADLLGQVAFLVAGGLLQVRLELAQQLVGAVNAGVAVVDVLHQQVVVIPVYWPGQQVFQRIARGSG